jgi:hypothetical protein
MTLTKATFSMIQGAPVNVLDFGAIGDGVADDTDAIQAAADYAASISAPLYGSYGTYKITDTISLVCDGDLSAMTIEVDGSAVSPAVRFGTTTGLPTPQKTMLLPRVNNTARVSGTWGSGTGVELANCEACSFTVSEITNFEVGLSCGGYTSGFVYCTVNLGNVYSNKINIRLRPAASGGWSNQNTFIGGRLGFNSTDFTVSGYVGTRQVLIEKGASSFGGPNTNTFIGTSFESDLVQYMVEFRESTANNVFVNCRYEGAGNEILFDTTASAGNSDNLFVGGYGVFSLTFTYSGAGSSLYNNIIGSRVNAVQGNGVVYNLANVSGDGLTAPHFQGFDATTRPLGKNNAASDWTYRFYSSGISGKLAADAHPRVSIDYSAGRMLIGAGSAAPTDFIGALGSAFATSRSWVPSTDNTRALGDASFRWTVVYAATGTINTSDARDKNNIRLLNDKEKSVGIALRSLVRAYNWKTGSTETYVGVIAQDVIAAFEAKGLSAYDYGVIDSNGEKLGVRYDQIFAFIIAAL